MNTDIPILNFEDVDFNIEKEVWNVYELADGVTIKARAVVLKFLRRTMQPGETVMIRTTQPIELAINSRQIMVVVRCPSSMLGKPSQLEDFNKAERTRVNYTPYLEDWNIYRLKDGTEVKIKLDVSSVSRAKDCFDDLGYPAYDVKSTNAVAVEGSAQKF